MSFLSRLLPLFPLALLTWNIGFWPRFVFWSGHFVLSSRQKIQILLGVPIAKVPVDISGSTAQIACYLLLVEAVVLALSVPDESLRTGIYIFSGLPIVWLAFGFVYLMQRRLGQSSRH